MAIKTECVVKSLKSDYKVIGPSIGAIIVSVALLYAIIVYNTIFTAFNVYILVELGSMLLIPCSIAFSKYTPESKEQMKGSSNTVLMIIINSLLIALFTCIYQAMSCSPSIGYCKFPDGVLLGVIFLVVNALIVCPLASAYARCKE